ncbi:MAG: hypothetical protein IKS02_04715 [Fibrobacter sp.]|nr:hypothetical protein [Fibrobacter sp.]
MKKIFLSAVIALALCSYGYAQDEEEYEEEDAAPAKVAKAPAYEEEEEEDEAPAPVAKKAEKKKEKKSSGSAFFGAGIDVGGLLNNAANMRLVFKLNESMELSAILGMYHHGESSYTPNGGQEQSAKDNYTELSIGAGFDFFVKKDFLPVSIGGEFIYTSPRALVAGGQEFVASNDIDLMLLQINVLLGAHAEITNNLFLTGKIGLGMSYYSESDPAGEGSFLDFALATKVYLTWFMF